MSLTPAELLKLRLDRGISAEELAQLKARAAEGEAKAQYELAQVYFHGRGVPVEIKEAFRLHCLAAAQGHAEAAYEAGHACRTGYGTAMDYKAAFDWYAKGAEGGSIGAMRGLIELYKWNLGVNDDPDKRRSLTVKIARGGGSSERMEVLKTYSEGGGEISHAEAAQWYFEIEASVNAFNEEHKNHYWYKDTETLPAIYRKSFESERPKKTGGGAG